MIGVSAIELGAWRKTPTPTMMDEPGSSWLWISRSKRLSSGLQEAIAQIQTSYSVDAHALFDTVPRSTITLANMHISTILLIIKKKYGILLIGNTLFRSINQIQHLFNIWPFIVNIIPFFCLHNHHTSAIQTLSAPTLTDCLVVRREEK